MSELIQIKTENSAVLTKLQKQFNTSIQKINNLKKTAITVKIEIERIQQRLVSDIIPIEKKLLEIHAKEIINLDAVYQENSLKKRDNDLLSEIISERLNSVIHHSYSKELDEIFARHNNGLTLEEASKKALEHASDTMKDKFSSMFGIEFDDDVDLSTPNEFYEYIDQQIEAENTASEARKSNRQKTAKQIEREEKARLEEKNLNKTSRQIYMELVKEFHPDREKDELEKEKKTLLMHKITEAYEKDDLFELLRLRLELIGTNLENTKDDNLKYYVKLLKQQIVELQAEIEEMQSFGQTSFFGPSLYERFASDRFMSLDAKFKREVTAAKKSVKEAEKSLPFYRDKTQVKFIIDDYRKEQKYRNQRGANFNEIFGLM
jgi:hypothetical protein